MAQSKDIDLVKKLPTIFVIFGATGDLSHKKIFPSLWELYKNNLLPQKLKIVASARSKLESAEFSQSVKPELKNTEEELWKKFSKHLEYISSDIEKNINLDKITSTMEAFEEEIKACPERIFYMAISPFIYEQAFENLGKMKLNLGCRQHSKRSKIVIEKPFGFDYESAQKLNRILEAYFEERQIYRIDHFLGKETVQNIFAFRFGNEIFEPIWNNKYIDHVQITAAEYDGVGNRGEYYDKAGALRDFVQNHLLQLLCIATMEEPKRFEHSSIRERKLEILRSIKRMTPEEVTKNTVRGQYEGYRQEKNVDPNSQTETYALIKLFIENERWAGVPFYLRTGKKLTGKVSSIIFSFKEKTHPLLENFWDKPMPNHITLQIEPNEGIGIRLVAKKPGLNTVLDPVDMEFCYKTSFDDPQPNAYERLLMDIIIGDQTLFIGQVGESWKIIDPIEKVWQSGKPPLAHYKPGSWGPEEADYLIEIDKRAWLAPLLTICKI